MSVGILDDGVVNIVDVIGIAVAAPDHRVGAASTIEIVGAVAADQGIDAAQAM